MKILAGSLAACLILLCCTAKNRIPLPVRVQSFCASGMRSQGKPAGVTTIMNALVDTGLKSSFKTTQYVRHEAAQSHGAIAYWYDLGLQLPYRAVRQGAPDGAYHIRAAAITNQWWISGKKRWRIVFLEPTNSDLWSKELALDVTPLCQ